MSAGGQPIRGDKLSCYTGFDRCYGVYVSRAGTSHDHNVKPEAIRKELHHLAEKVSNNDRCELCPRTSSLLLTV